MPLIGCPTKRWMTVSWCQLLTKIFGEYCYIASVSPDEWLTRSSRILLIGHILRIILIVSFAVKVTVTVSAWVEHTLKRQAPSSSDPLKLTETKWLCHVGQNLPVHSHRPHTGLYKPSDLLQSSSLNNSFRHSVVTSQTCKSQPPPISVFQTNNSHIHLEYCYYNYDFNQIRAS